MRVVVAEKPSVARDLARVLGATRRHDGYLEGSGLRITWCIGHLVELEEPAHYNPAWKRWSLDTLPMVPPRFALRVRKDGHEQFGIIRKLLHAKDATEVVNACDAGREGELIFRYVAELAENPLPVLRLWVSSLTDEAIREGWGKLVPAQRFDRLGDAARCRSEADWIVGLNATRALTVRARDAGGSDLLSVGRVQTPTLAMITARDQAIEQFVPETYYTIRGTFRVEREQPEEDADPTFQATWFRPEIAKTEAPDGKKPENEDEGDGGAPAAERLSDKVLAETVAKLTEGRTGRIELAERKRTTERPPPLYDLTSLQRRANQRYGMSAQRTLEVAQALYERHKLITYPRTDSRYLTPDQVPTLPSLLEGLKPVDAYKPFAEGILAKPIKPGPRVVNASEVGDHPAITPTGRTPDPSLEVDEKRIFDLVARRFLAALMEDALFDQTKIVVAVDPAELPPEGIPSPLRFRARGRVCRHPGWRAADPPGKSAELELPLAEVGDPAPVQEAEVIEGQTRPPRRHNDGSLLRSMETAGKALDDETLARVLRGRGLGTPATRASILQTLLDRQYIERHGKELHATPRGKGLIEAIPVEALKSAELTAEWEGRLSEMADGRGMDAASFMKEVAAWTTEIVAALIAAKPSGALAMTDSPEIGRCPKCGQPVRVRGRRYSCDSGSSCGFVVFDSIAQRSISLRTVKQLLAEGRTPAMKGFRSKAGKEFAAGLRWDAALGKVQLWFPERDPHALPAEEEPEEEVRPVAALPPVEEAPPQRTRERKPRAPRESKPRERKPRERQARDPAAPKRTRAPRAKREPKPPKPPPSALPPSMPSAPPLGVGDRCPTCGEGRIIQGRAALGCNRWREGCNFRVG
jgi:DNA topoisomerase-3